MDLSKKRTGNTIAHRLFFGVAILILIMTGSFSRADVPGVMVTPAAAPSLPAPPTPVWQKLFSCDQGLVWVDVDLNERRHIQVVSHDAAANQYMLNLAILPTTYANDFSQLTFILSQNDGIQKTSDFAVPMSQQGISFQNPIKISDDYMTRFSVVTRAFLDTVGGLKIEFVRTDMLICTFYDVSSQSCSGDRTYGVRDRYVGNWYFNGCQ